MGSETDLFSLCSAPLLGHVGDGNFHSFLLFDPAHPGEYERAEKLAVRMTEYASD